MYPDLTFFLKETFGIDLILPVKTFGFFLALSFFGAYRILYAEMQRKTKSGLFTMISETIQPESQKKNIYSKIIYIIIGTITGGKIGLIFENYTDFSLQPQNYIFSLNFSFLGLLAGLFITLWMIYRENKKEIPKEPVTLTVSPADKHLGNITGIAAIAGILGAKIFHNLENINELMADPVSALLSFSGLTFYGGLICAAAGIIYYCRIHKLGVIYIVDCFAPALMLAYSIGRMGCHLSGDGDWGLPNTAPQPGFLSFLPDWMWAFDYPHNVLNMGEIMLQHLGSPYPYHLVPAVYPTPFYESVISLLLFFILWFLRKKITTPGVLFSIYLLMNGTERFFIEKIRVNPPYHFMGIEASQATLISLALVLSGLVLFFYIRYKKDTPDTLVR